MTVKEDKLAESEPDIVAEAIPTGAAPTGPGNEPPIAAGHSRFYCNKCHTVSSCWVVAFVVAGVAQTHFFL